MNKLLLKPTVRAPRALETEAEEEALEYEGRVGGEGEESCCWRMGAMPLVSSIVSSLLPLRLYSTEAMRRHFLQFIH